MSCATAVSTKAAVVAADADAVPAGALPEVRLARAAGRAVRSVVPGREAVDLRVEDTSVAETAAEVWGFGPAVGAGAETVALKASIAASAAGRTEAPVPGLTPLSSSTADLSASVAAPLACAALASTRPVKAAPVGGGICAARRDKGSAPVSAGACIAGFFVTLPSMSSAGTASPGAVSVLDDASAVVSSLPRSMAAEGPRISEASQADNCSEVCGATAGTSAGSLRLSALACAAGSGIGSATGSVSVWSRSIFAKLGLSSGVSAASVEAGSMPPSATCRAALCAPAPAVPGAFLPAGGMAVNKAMAGEEVVMRCRGLSGRWSSAAGLVRAGA